MTNLSVRSVTAFLFEALTSRYMARFRGQPLCHPPRKSFSLNKLHGLVSGWFSVCPRLVLLAASHSLPMP